MHPTQIRDVSPTEPGFHVSVRHRPLWLALVMAAVIGLVVGSVDRALQDTLPYPLANLANSAAVWAVVAFAVGLWVASRAWYAAAAGVVTLLVAVCAYYGASAVFHGDDFSWLTARTTQFWLGFAVVVGALLGAAGTWARNDDTPIRVTAMALAPSVLFAEALNLVRLSNRPGADPGSRLGSTATIEIGCGVVALAALALFVARDRLDWVRVALVCVPVSLIGFGLYAASGYGG